MRQLIMWNLVTLDGYFDGKKPWDLWWHDVAWGEDLKRLSVEQTGNAGGLVFGRKTYEGMAAHWPSATGEVADIMNRIPKFVSRTLSDVSWRNAQLIKGDMEQEVSRLKREAGNDLFLLGSGDLGSELTQKKLIDEYRLCLVPVVLGDGRPLFKAGNGMKLDLVSQRVLNNGSILLSYRPNRS